MLRKTKFQTYKLRKPLTSKAKHLLDVIMNLIKEKKPVAGRPETYLNYGEIAEILLGHNMFGANPMAILHSNGLRELDGWIATNNKPELGLISVSQTDFRPSPFIFKRNNKKFSDFVWWGKESGRILNYDWKSYI